MRESLVEISSQKAEISQHFYFQYGHRSHRELAHIPSPSNASHAGRAHPGRRERVGTARASTRYQDFRRSGWFTPNSATQNPAGSTTPRTKLHRRSVQAYDAISVGMLEALKAAIPQPAEMEAAPTRAR